MSKKLNTILIMIVILSTSLFGFTSASDLTNIDNLAYVVAIGLDIGTIRDLKLSVQIAIPASQNSGGDSPTSVINSIECSSIDSGINLINSFSSKKLNLSHCKVIVISQALAALGVADYIYSLVNQIEIRPDTNIIVSKCTAEYFLDNSKPILEKMSAKYYEIVPTSSQYTGFTENITMKDFLSGLKDTFSSSYAILRPE